jgi:Zn-dependent protease with chaperone function
MNDPTPDTPSILGSGFAGYVQDRQAKVRGGTREDRRYAYGADLAMLRTFEKIPPIELAVSAVVRTYKDLLRNQYLGTTVRVGPNQLARIHSIAKECAFTLGVPMPTVYVANSPFMNAYTFGTNDDSFIVVHARLVDDFSDDELRFVIGHEMGHVQNNHVVYGTALRLLKGNLLMLFRILMPPAEAMLKDWSRKAEITCDRAGLICCRNLDAAMSSFVKMACGSTTLYEELNVETYIEQLEAGRDGLGRFGELLASHPYLPKRIRALQLFAESRLYRNELGLEGGLELDAVDAKTAEILRILRGRDAAPAGEGAE